MSDTMTVEWTDETGEAHEGTLSVGEQFSHDGTVVEISELEHGDDTALAVVREEGAAGDAVGEVLRVHVPRVLALWSPVV